jgi:hypothetical protein
MTTKHTRTSSVGPEHAEALSVVHAHGQALDGMLGRVAHVRGIRLAKGLDSHLQAHIRERQAGTLIADD